MHKSRRQLAITSYTARAEARRTGLERFADGLTKSFGTVTFLVINAIWFLIWIVWNTGQLGVAAFDPFPYGLLTMIVSLEAIFLAIIVLISENRAARVASLREEIDLQVNMIAEEEVTKIMQMLVLLMEKNGFDFSTDPEMERMLRPVKNEDIEKALEDEIAANSGKSHT
jgi:uncharacterized membrane protein